MPAAVHRVVALVRPPQSTFELGCVAEVFGIELPETGAREGAAAGARLPLRA